MKEIHDRFSRPVLRSFFVVTFVIAGLCATYPVYAEEENCVSLLTGRCEQCHYLTRVCQKVDKERSKKSWFGGPEGSWKKIMKSMVKQGAKLNKDEEELLVKCLSKPGPDVLEICHLKEK